MAAIDIVVSFETIEHVPDDCALIAEFRRVLRPGGQLIVSTPNQWPLADAPFHVREYDRQSFEAVLDPRFRLPGNLQSKLRIGNAFQSRSVAWNRRNQRRQWTASGMFYRGLPAQMSLSKENSPGD